MTPHDILYRIILGVNCFSLFYVITVSTICLIQLISASIGLRQLFFYSFIDNFGYRQLNTVYKVEAMFGFKKTRVAGVN